VDAAAARAQAAAGRRGLTRGLWRLHARPRQDGRADRRHALNSVRLEGLSTGTSPSAGLRIAGAFAWLGLALLGLAVKVVLFPRHRSGGAMAVVWGVIFGLFLWWGSHQVGLGETRAILLGIAGGIGSGLYIYSRGSNLEGAAAEKPGAFIGRRLGRKKPRQDKAGT
jgi:hypothetical protein